MAGQQFIKQHAEAVDVAARVNVQSAQPRLFGAHVGGSADELFEGGEEGFVGEPLIGRGLGDTEVNDLGHDRAVLFGDQNV